MTHQATFSQPSRLEQGSDGASVLLETVLEVKGLVAVAVPEEVDKQRSATLQRRLHCCGQQLTSRGALPAMKPNKGRILTRELDVTDECPIVG